jgi:hypothetical protein
MFVLVTFVTFQLAIPNIVFLFFKLRSVRVSVLATVLSDSRLGRICKKERGQNVCV